MLINLRNALMTGKRLPYDAEVEWLQGDGASYIATGLVWNPYTTKATVVAYTPSVTRQYLLGSYGSSHNYLGYLVATPQLRVTPAGNPSLLCNVNEWNTLECYNINNTWYNVANGVSSTISNARSDTNRTLDIFRINDIAQHLSTSRIARLYLTDIASGALVADYIPVRKKTVGYLYDRVSRKLFGNAGTGAFAFGQDVVPVEYLESYGSQYIATDFIPNDSSGIYLKSAPMVKADVVHVGCRSTANGRWWVNYGSEYINSSWNTFASTSIAYASGRVYVVENNYLNSRSFVVNGETKNTDLYSTTLATTTNPAAIFAANSSGSITLKAKCKIYELRFSQGSAIARDFCPIRVGTEGAMMDVLTRRIYRNAGTGAFTYGNDLKYPIPAA